MKSIKTLVVVAGLWCFSLVYAAGSPVPMLEQTANQIINTLKDNKANLKKNPQIIYKAVEKNLLPIVDVPGMSRSVLGRQAWTKATPAQRAKFSQEFTRLVIRTYSSPLAQYSDEKVQFLPVRGVINSRFIRVNSVIVRSQGQNIPLTYSLVDKNGAWRIYDISVEGVSLLQSFRSQFAQVLQNSTIDEVIHQMQNNQLKKVS
ncbi:MAG: signal peptidase [Legionella sp. 40-6]|nr:ABC transporter substrate-binding protein [Legionella sp.]OJY38350.1 MAG: signal peptidase [Legionella sp. 40-6]